MINHAKENMRLTQFPGRLFCLLIAGSLPEIPRHPYKQIQAPNLSDNKPAQETRYHHGNHKQNDYHDNLPLPLDPRNEGKSMYISSHPAQSTWLKVPSC
jgi:hypothetical protein